MEIPSCSCTVPRHWLSSGAGQRDQCLRSDEVVQTVEPTRKTTAEYEWCSIACKLASRRVSKFLKPVPGGDPDPDGFHLAIVARALRLVLDIRYEEVVLFWDFGSLHQPPRVQDQEELFKQGLQASNRWYGSTQSTVLPGSQLTYRDRLSRCDSFSLSMPFLDVPCFDRSGRKPAMRIRVTTSRCCSGSP